MMKNKLFKKTYTVIAITILINILVFGGIIFNTFRDYFVNNRAELLLEQGEAIAHEISKAIITGRIDNAAIHDEIQTLDKFLDARIWLVSADGEIVGISSTEDQGLLGKAIDLGDVNALKGGHSQVYNGKFNKFLSYETATVACPISTYDVYYGAVLVHSKITSLSSAARGVRSNTFIILMSTMVALYIALFVIIRKVTRPLAQISAAAKEIAGGEFEKRLSINTNDEIEDLSNSFNHMAESLENIENNRRTFISNLSHDLRSPMTSIRGFAEGMLDGTIPDEKKDYYLNIILDESKRMMKITNDILELNNMQQGVRQPIKEKVEICELIRRIIIGYENKVVKKHLKMEIQWAEKDEVWANTDINYIERVLVNLLDNAVKFTPEHGTISVILEENKDNINVIIENTTYNIEEDSMKKMWERFHKGDKSRGEDKEGFGLGLSIVKEIISQLGESIDIKLEGTKIIFKFSLEKHK